MQLHDLPCNPAIANSRSSDLRLASMADSSEPSSPSPIHSPVDSQESGKKQSLNKVSNNHSKSSVNSSSNNNGNLGLVGRRERPSRACTQRATQRMQAAAAAEAAALAAERRLKKKAASRREKLRARLVREELDEEEEEAVGSSGEEEEEEEDEEGEGDEGGVALKKPSSKEITQLVGEPEPSQVQRWTIRGMWQLASILNFLNVFRHLLNIKTEFSVEEFETALITPNNTLGDIHIPLLKSIPPVTRMALGHGTWVTVLCRKLRDWWLWVAEGELPIVASHGAEIEAYNSLDPAVRVIILKAICDIRVEQDDIRNYIDNSIKHGIHISTFRKERVGGDSHGVSYWYEDDSTIGHRLYREFRKIEEVKKGKGRNIPPIADSCYQWETVATSFDEFQDVSEKLFSSKNRTEVSVGKKLRKNMLPEIEKLHKKREKLLKKQHRQAMMLDNMMNIDGLAGGRSLRDRKPVTYTFDDYDRSITEAIKTTKKNQVPGEFMTTRREGLRYEASMNGSRSNGGPSESNGELSPKSPDYDGYDENGDQLERSNRRRQRPERYSAREFVEAVSDNDADFDSDEDIVGEVVYDDEYLRKRKQRRKMSSSSEGDDEYHADDDNLEDEEEEEEEEDDGDSFSPSDESDRPHKSKKLSGRTRRETKLRSVGNLQSGLRRSNRATRNRIDYRQYELSDSESELVKPGKSNTLPDHLNDSENADRFSGASQDSDEENMENADKFSAESQDSEEEENMENADKFSPASQDSEENVDDEEDAEDMKVDEQQEVEPAEEEAVKDEAEKADSPKQAESGEGGGKRRFLDLNELAPGSGFDDGPNTTMKDEDTDDF